MTTLHWTTLCHKTEELRELRITDGLEAEEHVRDVTKFLSLHGWTPRNAGSVSPLRLRLGISFMCAFDLRVHYFFVTGRDKGPVGVHLNFPASHFSTLNPVRFTPGRYELFGLYFLKGLSYAFSYFPTTLWTIWFTGTESVNRPGLSARAELFPNTAENSYCFRTLRRSAIIIVPNDLI